mmetsp:Transcript_17058/g.47239  ORF Transcript_17058/g.47239 Transcript_17058/m.47239 type:complete len:237 (-) Transcript_17058:14-724(-)
MNHAESAVHHPAVVQILGALHLGDVHAAADLCLQRPQRADGAWKVRTDDVFERRCVIPHAISQQTTVVGVALHEGQIAPVFHVLMQGFHHVPHRQWLHPEVVFVAFPFAFGEVRFPLHAGVLATGVFLGIQAGVVLHVRKQVLLQRVGDEGWVGLELECDARCNAAVDQVLGKRQVRDELEARIVDDDVDVAAAVGLELVAVVRQHIRVVVQQVLRSICEDAGEDVHVGAGGIGGP